ncbi:dipeptidase PepE [Ferrovibrio sp.]|uniref:dipeptidase PepE n=1 Tax=Ferrovibrio sp. TaxID=1917215 RepID=UPI003D0E0175
MIRALLISNSGRPFLRFCLPEIADFLGPVRRLGYITAARLGDAESRFAAAADALSTIGVVAEHFQADSDLPARIKTAEAVFVGGGNTYVLLQRLRECGALAVLTDRARGGMPYIGTSAGSNIAGHNILCTNDWNVIGATRFDAMGLVPWTLNPHYLEADPAMAPGSETRDDRIREYHAVNTNPVLGIEESTAIRVERGNATVVGSGRVKLFRRAQPVQWLASGEAVPLHLSAAA